MGREEENFPTRKTRPWPENKIGGEPPP